VTIDIHLRKHLTRLMSFLKVGTKLQCCEYIVFQIFGLITDIALRSDATAGWTVASKNAAVEHSWPAFAHEVILTKEWQQKVVGKA